MRLGGIETSLVNWEGHVSAVLFFAGCNFRCVYCHNPELIPKRSGTYYEPEEVLEIVEKRIDIIDSMIMCGGEPTCQSWSVFVECMGMANHLDLISKLDTNGSDPWVVEKAINNGLDRVSLDVKARPDPTYYEFVIGRSADTHLVDILKTMRITDKHNVELEVRTTVVPSLNDTPDDIQAICEWIQPYTEEYTIQRYDPTNVYNPLLQLVIPPTMEEMEVLGSIAEDYIPKVNIRPRPL